MLSACESGFGTIVSGEGSMSIAKSFFQAGAKSTLVSLWPVDDCATSDLMGYFYRNLKNGVSKDEALRLAKLDFRENANPIQLHPYYWAGMIQIGDPTPLFYNSAFSIKRTWPFIVGFIILFIAIGTYLKYKRSF